MVTVVVLERDINNCTTAAEEYTPYIFCALCTCRRRGEPHRILVPGTSYQIDSSSCSEKFGTDTHGIKYTWYFVLDYKDKMSSVHEADWTRGAVDDTDSPLDSSDLSSHEVRWVSWKLFFRFHLRPFFFVFSIATFFL